jgi:hypothetical protein
VLWLKPANVFYEKLSASPVCPIGNGFLRIDVVRENAAPIFAQAGTDHTAARKIFVKLPPHSASMRSESQKTP